MSSNAYAVSAPATEERTGSFRYADRFRDAIRSAWTGALKAIPFGPHCSRRMAEMKAAGKRHINADEIATYFYVSGDEHVATCIRELLKDAGKAERVRVTAVAAPDNVRHFQWRDLKEAELEAATSFASWLLASDEVRKLGAANCRSLRRLREAEMAVEARMRAFEGAVEYDQS